MTHALIQDGEIVATGNPPSRVYDGTDWYDGDDPASGWQPITTDPHPDVDPDTQTATLALTIRDGQPVRAWTVRDYTADEIRRHAETSARLDDHEARISLLEAAVWPEGDTPTDPETAPLWPGIVYPGRTYRETDGTLWTNASTVPLTEPISRFPGPRDAWTHLWRPATTGTGPGDPNPEAPAPAPWDPQADYTVGDTCTKDGRIWECLIPHGPERQGTWAPGVAHTVWKDLGPA